MPTPGHTLSARGGQTMVTTKDIVQPRQQVPSQITIEVTNICNARCTICPAANMTRERKVMGFQLFKKVIDELAEINYSGLVIPELVGESLLAPNFVDYLRYIRERLPDAEVELFSNASKLDKVAEPILNEDLLDTLIVSFDGGTKETYEAVRRGLSFDKVSSNVHNFLSRRSELGKKKPHVEIHMVVTKENHHTKGRLRELFEDADVVVFVGYVNWGGQHGTSSHPKGKMASFLRKLNFCGFLNYVMCIMANGDVALCCMDFDGREIIGDVRSHSIMDVWNGEKRNQKIDDLKHRRFERLPLCAGCSIISVQGLGVKWLLRGVFIKYPPVYNFLRNLWFKLGLK